MGAISSGFGGESFSRELGLKKPRHGCCRCPRYKGGPGRQLPRYPQRYPSPLQLVYFRRAYVRPFFSRNLHSGITSFRRYFRRPVFYFGRFLFGCPQFFRSCCVYFRRAGFYFRRRARRNLGWFVYFGRSFYFGRRVYFGRLVARRPPGDLTCR